MKWNKILSAVAGSVLAFSACSDSSSGASRESDSSSSGEILSSSSSSDNPTPAFDIEKPERIKPVLPGGKPEVRAKL